MSRYLVVVVSAEILPHPSLHCLVESFYHDCFSLVMCTIHFDALLFQIFLKRSIVKFRTLINPELGWFSSATRDDVIKCLRNILSLSWISMA